jgi:hypothetical protein
MRLIDEIQAAVGTEADRVLCGSITSMARALADAQCFELAPEVVQACGHVATSKPSSLLSAMPMTRLPYAKTWIEWQPPDDGVPHLIVNYTAERPKPVRMGCLFEAATPDRLAQGFMSWAWLHTEVGGGLVVLPYAVQFDWRADGNVLTMVDHIAELFDTMPAELRRELRQHGLNADGAELRRYTERQRLDPGQAAELLRRAKKSWARLAADPEEQIALVRLMERAIVCPNQHCVDLWFKLNQVAQPDAIDRLAESWRKDLEGEPDFALAFVIMLNAKAALEQTPDDFVRLNRRRALAGKPALREFVVTRLNLSHSRSRNATAQGMSRNAARQHLVRGHFKVRSSGIFWWSPFVRGGPDAVDRGHYRVGAP